MKKSIKCLVATAALILTVSAAGCDKTSTEDTYIRGTDFPYQYADKEAQQLLQVPGKDARFFCIGKYIYRLDEKTEILTPLCNKTNCLHDRETDEKRRAACNAYTLGDVGISYMDGYIYSVMTESGDTHDYQVLYKIAEDGSVREKVYQWKKDIVGGWCLHRGILCYVEHTFNNKNEEHYALKLLNTSGKAEPETIYEQEDGVTVFAFGIPKAYGNHFYISMNGARLGNVDTDTLTSEEDWLKYRYDKFFHYHIQDKTLSEIQAPNQSAAQAITDVTFWQDKIIYQAFDSAKAHQYDAVSNVYIADLDGKNAKVFIKNDPQYHWYSSDGKYLYVSDAPEKLDKVYHSPEFKKNIDGKFDYGEVTIDVYDKDMKLVDTMVSPFKEAYEPAYGEGERMYAIVNNGTEDSINIEYWDKKKLGSYHGSKYNLTKLCEQKYSEKDMQEIRNNSGE